MYMCMSSIPVATRVERTVSEREYPAENARLSLASYRAIPLGTAPNRSFPVRSKTKKSWSHFNSAHVRAFGTWAATSYIEVHYKLRLPSKRHRPIFSHSITLIVARMPSAIEREPHATSKTAK